jgi:hypothetical protein
VAEHKEDVLIRPTIPSSGQERPLDGMVDLRFGEIMGKLYCMCKEASKQNCHRCWKNEKIKPDHTVNCPTWPKEKRLGEQK